jgi:hypothetical protein
LETTSRKETETIRWNGEDKNHCYSTQYLGSNLGYERKITTVGVQGKYSIHASSNSSNEFDDDERKRNELFHIRVVSKHTKIDTLFDPSFQLKLISKALVKKMGLEMKQHPKPYPLSWVCDKEKLNVTKQCRVIFFIASKLNDEVDLYVVSLDISGIVLGGPYLYDRKIILLSS